jgi:hypothetical protein
VTALRDVITHAATDSTGDNPVLMACAVALARRWGDPAGGGDLHIREDPRTVVQVVLNALLHDEAVLAAEQDSPR